MRVASRALVQFEQIAQISEREVPLDVLLVVHDARTQRLLVRLPLKNLLLDRASLKAKQPLAQ